MTDFLYPKHIQDLIAAAKDRKRIQNVDAAGTAATFVCGIAVEFLIEVDEETRAIENVDFRTNGCGYVVAAAQSIISKLRGVPLEQLSGLTGLQDDVLIGEVSAGRKHCMAVCDDAISNAFAAYRKSRVEEWNGEQALICSCFGVSESEIEIAAANGYSSIDEIGNKTGAGTGCGSCQQLIGDIVDSVEI